MGARTNLNTDSKKVEELGQVKAGEGGAGGGGGGGAIYFSPGEMYFSPHLLPSRQCLPQGLIYPLSPIFLSGKRELKQR